MEIKLETIKNDCVQMVAEGQTVVISDIDTQDRGGAAKLLSVSTDATVQSVEAVAGEAHVYGRVNYKVLYLDPEDKICGIDYFAEYDLSIREDAIAAQDTLATADILDAECTLVGHVIHLESVCGVRVRQVVSHEAKAVCEAEGEARYDTVTATTLSPVPETVFEVVEEVESRRSIDRVLVFDAHAVHTATRKGVDSTVVEGKIYANVVYRSQGDILNRQVLFDYSEQLDVEGDVDLSVSVRQARLVLTGEDDNTVLRIEVNLCVKGYRLTKTEVRTVLDAYCPDADIRPTEDRFVCRRYLGMVSREDRISGRIDAALPPARDIVATTVSHVNVANWIAEDGRIIAEGLAVAGVLYTDEDGHWQAGEVELPFSVSFAADGATPDSLLVGEVAAVGTNAGERGNVEMDLAFSVKLYQPVIVRYLTDITATPCAQSRAVLSVYFAPAGADVWDVAHAVHVSPTELLAQNPDWAEPSADEVRRVTVFRHRDLD